MAIATENLQRTYRGPSEKISRRLPVDYPYIINGLPASAPLGHIGKIESRKMCAQLA